MWCVGLSEESGLMARVVKSATKAEGGGIIARTALLDAGESMQQPHVPCVCV